MAITGWSGLWNGLVSGVSGAAPNSGYAFQNTTQVPTKTRKIAKMLRTRGGVVAGGTALTMDGETFKRSVAPTDSKTNVTALGGARSVETITPTAISEANFKAALVVDSQPAYPVDRSGNGGGGKVSNGRSNL